MHISRPRAWSRGEGDLMIDLCARPLICARPQVCASHPLATCDLAVQLMKKIIHMSNYKSPAYQICHFWSMRSALLLLEKSGRSVDIADDGFDYSSELRFNLTPQRIAQSVLMTSVAAGDAERWQSVYATRHVRSFERGSLEVRANDWVVVSRNGQSCIGRVGEMIEFVASGGRFVRMLLRDARPIPSFDPILFLCQGTFLEF
jgi:hypothetical protein